jgi:hypothetical protein
MTYGDMSDKFRVISGAQGPSSYPEYSPGKQASFYHDQTSREFPPMQVVDLFPTTLESLQKIAKIVGKNSVSFSVFK